ncbi:GNAT family N-acetyltransferase [Chitinophaga lutea]
MSEANDVRVLSWHPDYQPYFERFNKTWISQFFVLEPQDYDVLEHPQEHILAHGGNIIFVAIGDQIAGTVGWKKVDDTTVEMTKMAVDEQFRGRKLGWLLAVSLMEQAAQAGYRRMILYSNTKQAPAIAMYRKLGFEEMELETGGYARCNIKMGIDLPAPPLQALADELDRTVRETTERLLEFTDEEAGARRAPDKWSRKEVLGHLIDSAWNNYNRFVRAQQADYNEFPGYAQGFWVEVRQYQQDDWASIVELWKAVNGHIVRIFPRIPAASLDHICVIGGNAPVTLQFVADDYLRHLRHHLGQIFPVHANY